MDTIINEKLQTILPLRDLELAYKALYTETGFSTDESAITMEEFESYLADHVPQFLRLGSETLGPSSSVLSDTDSAYFAGKHDVSAVQHLRYLPAILHTHNFFEIAFVLQGSLTHFIESEKNTLNRGDVFILAPNTEHSVCTYSDDAILINVLVRNSLFEQHFLNIIPNDYIMRSFFANALYSINKSPYLIFRTGDDPRLAEYVINLLNECNENRPYKDTLLNLMVSLLFIFLLREHEQDVVIPQLNEGSITDKVLVILDYMEHNYADITLKQMAEFFSYSERQLSRIIKTATGKNYEALIRDLRMRRAKELLEYSDLSISEISDSLGYYDTSNFRQAFKKYYRTTPADYRARIYTKRASS